MRTIKFRAWHKEEKKYYYELTIVPYTKDVFGKDDDGNLILGEIFLDNSRYSVFYPETVVLMQFTGLLDKNGKEIYEGDVVKLEGWEPKRYEVVFDRGGFCLKFGEDSNFYPDIKYAENAEVIGNIYENPELLK